MNADRLTLGDKLQVAFQWAGDRYAHNILCCPGIGEAATLLSSCEGVPDQWWPPSPPLQQLHISELEHGQRAALLVGMAGRSHWSLSVIADDKRHVLLFDAACRANLAPERLGSHYRVASGVQVAQGPDVSIRFGSATCSLAVDPIESEPTPRLLLSEREASVCPSSISRALPTTFRWKYRITLHSCEPSQPS